MKNIIIQTAKLQLIGNDICYYIILDGTDRLEGLFSNCRTQDHSRNFNLIQLSQKLAIATELTAVFIRNPDLYRGHQRLELQGAEGVDHVNPCSWKGDVSVGKVNLEKVWKDGQANVVNVILLLRIQV